MYKQNPYITISFRLIFLILFQAFVKSHKKDILKSSANNNQNKVKINIINAKLTYISTTQSGNLLLNILGKSLNDTTSCLTTPYKLNFEQQTLARTSSISLPILKQRQETPNISVNKTRYDIYTNLYGDLKEECTFFSIHFKSS